MISFLLSLQLLNINITWSPFSNNLSFSSSAAFFLLSLYHVHQHQLPTFWLLSIFLCHSSFLLVCLFHMLGSCVLTPLSLHLCHLWSVYGQLTAGHFPFLSSLYMYMYQKLLPVPGKKSPPVRHKKSCYLQYKLAWSVGTYIFQPHIGTVM